MNKAQMNYEVLVDRLAEESRKYCFSILWQGRKTVVRFQYKGRSYPLFISYDEDDGTVTFQNKTGTYLRFSDAFEAHNEFWNIWKRLKGKRG